MNWTMQKIRLGSVAEMLLFCLLKTCRYSSCELYCLFLDIETFKTFALPHMWSECHTRNVDVSCGFAFGAFRKIFY